MVTTARTTVFECLESTLSQNVCCYIVVGYNCYPRLLMIGVVQLISPLWLGYSHAYIQSLPVLQLFAVSHLSYIDNISQVLNVTTVDIAMQ